MKFSEWANYHRVGILICGAGLALLGILMVVMVPNPDTMLTALFWFACAAGAVWLSKVHLLFRRKS